MPKVLAVVLTAFLLPAACGYFKENPMSHNALAKLVSKERYQKNIIQFQLERLLSAVKEQTSLSLLSVKCFM